MNEEMPLFPELEGIVVKKLEPPPPITETLWFVFACYLGGRHLRIPGSNFMYRDGFLTKESAIKAAERLGGGWNNIRIVKMELE